MSEETQQDQIGNISWFECMTPDPAAAIAFYTQLFGWTTEAMDMANGGTYTMFLNQGKPIAGVMDTSMLGDTPPPPHWMNYVVVEDIKASSARITELGGSIIHPVTEVGGKGLFLIMTDPTGAAISLWQSLCDESA